MSRRKQNGEQEFGSDSFLDIIANIVGILIILIVIAGMKVANQPATVVDPVEEKLAAIQESLDVPEVEQPTIDEELAQLILPSEEDADAAESLDTIDVDLPNDLNPFPDFNTNPFADLDTFQPAEDTEFVPPEATTIAEDTGRADALNQEIDGLTLELENVRLEIAGAEQRLDSLMQQLQSKVDSDKFLESRHAGIIEESERLRAALASIEQQLIDGDQQSQTVEATLAGLSDRQEYITSAMRQVGQETQRLKEVLDEASEINEETDRLEHRISPVSRDATEEELHFRLAEGSVAHIPLERLLERLKEQVSHRRNVVQRFYRSEGLVGPVGGFRMNYVVERRAVAPLQALQYGQNAFQTQVSRWTILPAETLAAEPVEQALTLGSRFRQVIETAPPGTVLTIWLYPDDFSSFGKLRELAHRLNLRVAARPLPEGTQIAGSPNGSRSSSQ